MKTLNLLVILIASLIAISASAKTSLVIEMTRPLTASEIQILQKQLQGTLSGFGKSSDYFSRIYSIETNLNTEQVSNHPLVKNIESVTQVETFGIIPRDGAQPPTQDPLSIYQWGLHNSEQVISVDVDDITTKRRPGLKNFDVQATEARSLQFPRNPVVAVIDYGIDINHPDIKEHIYMNDSECSDGAVPINPKEDKDGNGYIGDCQGWNFTSGDKGSNRVIDDSGHGTHVAGVIAAIPNNGVGISGIHSQIRILPLQVLKKVSSPKDFSSRSDWLARAVLYAAAMKVDVINMSLGWPLFLDQKHLREAVQTALKAGVVIVAAAGNNNHDAPIFPCAYKGVICVGSVNNDGRISDFSNFGSHVDLLAPGDNVLSLLPMNMQPDYFSVQGYEVKSGTSQAAPAVSAAAALLKAQNQWNARQVLAKLLTSSQAVIDAKKTFSGGMLQISSALNARQKSLVRPVLKETRIVLANLQERSFQFPLEVENLSATNESAQIQISVLGNEFSLSQRAFSLNLAPWQIETLNISGSFANVEGSNNVSLKISVTTSAGTTEYFHQVELARDLKNDTEVVKVAVPAEASQGLRTVPSRWLKNPKIIYFSPTVDSSGTKLVFFEYDISSIRKLGEVFLPKVTQLLTLVQTDVNLDGKIDFEIQAVQVEGDTKSVHFYHFTENLEPLWGQQSEWAFDVESVLMPPAQVQSLTVQHETFGKIQIPVFMAVGTIPKLDQNQDPFTPPNLSVAGRLYYLYPTLKDGKVTVSTRIVDSPVNLTAWKKQMGLSFFEDIRLLYNLAGQNLVLSAGEGFNRSPWNIGFQLGAQGLSFQIQKLQSQHVLDGFFMDEAIDLNFSEKTPMTLVGQYSSDRWDILHLDSRETTPLQTLTPHDPSETLQVYVKTFIDDLNTFSFAQTPSEILLQKRDSQGIQRMTYAFHVSTFISQDMYSERAYPVITRLGGRVSPALLVDSSQITAQNIFLLTTDGEKLLVPVKTSLNIPSQCQPMNPQIAKRGSPGKFIFLCEVSEKKMELWSLPME